MTRQDLLETAIDYVTRDRAATHGAAGNGFAAIAMVWDALDQARGARPRQPHDVALYLAGLKLVRAATNPAHADNWVDLAGYAACGGEIAVGLNDTPQPSATRSDGDDQSIENSVPQDPDHAPADIVFGRTASTKKKHGNGVSLAAEPWESDA